MGRLYTLLLGMVVGFGLCYAAMTYHIVHARDGLHLVAKVPARLEEVYVDLRSMSAGDLAQRPQLLAALQRANMGHLLGDEVQARLQERIDNLFDQVAPPPQQPAP